MQSVKCIIQKRARLKKRQEREAMKMQAKAQEKKDAQMKNRDMEKKYNISVRRVQMKENKKAARRQKRNPTRRHFFETIDDSTKMKVVYDKALNNVEFRRLVLAKIGPGLSMKAVFGDTLKIKVDSASISLSDNNRSLNKAREIQYDAHEMRIKFTNELRSNKLILTQAYCNNMQVAKDRDLQDDADENVVSIDCAHVPKCQVGHVEIHFNPKTGLPMYRHCKNTQAAINKIRHQIAMLKMQSMLIGGKCIESSVSHLMKNEIYDPNVLSIIKDMFTSDPRDANVPNN
jgi:hypothetical protein